MGFVRVLPPIYNSTNYPDCISNNMVYCRVVAGILPNVENDLWKEIAHLRSNENLLDRSLVHRGLCLQGNGQQLEAEAVVNGELSPLNLSAETKMFFCYDDDESGVTDLLLMTTSAILLFTVLLATVKINKGTPKGFMTTFLSKFSIVENWRKMTKLEGNEDFERLKSIQGVRIVTMVLILVFHAKLQFSWMYISNVDYVEDIVKNFVLYHLFEQFLVQIFFLISAFLLAIQIHRIYEKNGKFDSRDVVIVLLNRYFRLQVTSVVLILLYSSNFWQTVSGPKLLELLKVFQNACRNHWAATLFLYNNFKDLEDACNSGTWYLSADFQMYVILTLILYIKYKYNINDWTSLSVALVTSIVVYALIIYTHNLDIIFRPIMRNVEYVHVMRSESFRLSYSSTWSTASTSILGAVAGTVYYRTKNVTIQQRNLVTVLWVLCFLGLPTLAVLLSASTVYEGVGAAIIGSVVKPLYALGFAIGILGMSHNIGGPFKKFFENRHFLVLSNFCYSTYLVNMFPAMLKIARDTRLVTMSPIFMFQEVVIFVMVGLVLGVMLTFLIEFPMCQIQKIVLPQVTVSDKKQR